MFGLTGVFLLYGAITMKKIVNGLAQTAKDLGRMTAHTVKKKCRDTRHLIEDICYDVNAFRQRDPAAHSNVEIVLLYSGFHARVAHRVAHGLYKKGHSFSARAVSQVAKALTGIEIHPGATIGRGLVIDHGMGVVIGETAEIGNDCTIYQGVTLGGTGKDLGKRHPTLGNNVMVGAGAKVLGPMTIGDNAKIAAGAVVLAEVPPNSTAVGIPAKVVRVGGARVANDLDQVNVPDPVKAELESVRRELEALSAEISKLKSPEKGNSV